MQVSSLKALSLAIALSCAVFLAAQDTPPNAPSPQTPQLPKSDPQYEDTFSGPIVELKDQKITVSRNVLGKPEKRTFLMKPDTKVEGKLKVKAKVTVGFVTTDDGDVARLIVVRAQQGQNQKK